MPKAYPIVPAPAEPDDGTPAKGGAEHPETAPSRSTPAPGRVGSAAGQGPAARDAPAGPPSAPSGARGGAHLLDTFTRARSAKAAQLRRMTGVPLLLGAALGITGIVLNAISIVNSTRWMVAVQLTMSSSPLLLLSVPPTHPNAVSFLCVATAAVAIAFGLLCMRIALGLHEDGARLDVCPVTSHLAIRVHSYALTAAIQIGVGLANLATTARRLLGGLTARAQLDAFWNQLAVLYLACGVPFLPLLLYYLALVPRFETTGMFTSTLLPQLVTLALGGFCADRRQRMRLHGWLAARGEGVNAAAGIAALIGRVDPSKAVTEGKRRLRAISAHLLTVDVFDAKKPASGWVALSQPAELDGVDCFVSHSWQDDPAAKFAALQAWRAEFVAAHRREPLVWLDRCCIAAAGDDLPHLPIFIAACRQLLILAGPTYASRLWCLVECFVFDVMAPHAGAADEATRASMLQMRLLPGVDVGAFATIDVRRCECALREDCDRLIAVMESAYGSTHAFNHRARVLLLRMPRAGGKPPGVDGRPLARVRPHAIPPASVVRTAARAVAADKRRYAPRLRKGPVVLVALLVAAYLGCAVAYSSWALGPALAECGRCEAARAGLRVPGEPGWFFASEAAAAARAGRTFSYSALGDGPLGAAGGPALPWREAARACAAAGGALARPADAAEERALQCLLGRAARGAWLGMPDAGAYAHWGGGDDAPTQGAVPLEAGATCPELSPWGLLPADCTLAYHYACERPFPAF